MPPTTPRLRILSGQYETNLHSPAQCAAAPLFAAHPNISPSSKSLPTHRHHLFHIAMGQLTRTICVVGGNAVSAFLSWRLSATNACDVTLVWKSGFEGVSQYGISFRYELCDTFGKSATDFALGRVSSATNASNRDMVSPPASLLPVSDIVLTPVPQLSEHQKRQRATRALPLTTSSSASKPYPMSTTSPP